MRARIDISEVEARTKIRAKYLRAIENEEWDLLPGPIYVKSFLRTYGDYLGLDSRLLIDDYKRRYERPSDNELRPIASLHRERERAARGPLLPRGRSSPRCWCSSSPRSRTSAAGAGTRSPPRRPGSSAAHATGRPATAAARAPARRPPRDAPRSSSCARPGPSTSASSTAAAAS